MNFKAVFTNFLSRKIALKSILTIINNNHLWVNIG